MSDAWHTLNKLAEKMERSEAAASIKSTGPGSRRDGAGFEKLVGELWEAVRVVAVDDGATSTFVEGVANRRWARLAVGERVLYLPSNTGAIPIKCFVQPEPWLEVDFDVTELIHAYPGMQDAVARYAPPSGPFAGQDYPNMFRDLCTKFDDTIVLEESGVLREKILLEYKTGKSSKGSRMDANVHERLSFQIMQYLEVATRYTACSLLVLTNGAYSRYRNKYHVNFRVQAERLQCFRWFEMQDASTSTEYLRVICGLLRWLKTGADRRIVQGAAQ